MEDKGGKSYICTVIRKKLITVSMTTTTQELWAKITIPNLQMHQSEGGAEITTKR